MAGNGQKITGLRQRLFKMVSVGIVDDRINQGYDIISTAMLLINLFGAFAGTFDQIVQRYGFLLHEVEAVTVAFFAVDYVLRLYTAPCLYPDETGMRPYVRYMLSGAGIIDLLSFLPYYLPMFFPAGAVAFRLIRVARILRLFRINAYYDSLNVITDVIVGKSQQLLSSVFIIFVLMLASSLAMYSIEHEAQPEVFRNAFSGLWWAVSTLLTVGYGDIYPITPLGKAFGILITFLGVGMVAVSTAPDSWNSIRDSSGFRTMRRKRICILSRSSSLRKTTGTGRASQSCGCPTGSSSQLSSVGGRSSSRAETSC